MSGDAALTRAERPARPAPAISFFEFWPGWLFYAPVVAHCIALGVRHGSPALLTAANPRITAGGLCGESKTSILDQIALPEERAALASYTVLDVAGSGADLGRAEAAMEAAGLAYPIVAKPDIGCNGTGVRLASGRDDLARYLAGFPPGERVVLQEFIAAESEAGLFYVRHPDEVNGRITSVTLKETPVVVGDGRATLRDLVLADRRAGRLAHLYFPRLAARLAEVPAQGVRVPLVFVGNHCKGAIFRDGAGHITPALTARIERLA
ncbi:MAG: D-alanine--D-alanine ligase, partial [Acetobacteraceae bacterium]